MAEYFGKTGTAQTVADFINGSRQAFATLYDRYAPALFGMLVTMTGNRQWAEEALQQSFVTAWKNRLTCNRNKCGFFPWILGIARNIVAEAGVLNEKGSTANHEAVKEVYNRMTQTTSLQRTLKIE